MNENLKKTLLALSFPILWISGNFRPYFLLRIIRFLSKLPGGWVLVDIYDPNLIRKKVNITFKQNLVPLNLDRASYIVDINEHLGYKFFIKDEFDPLVLHVASLLSIDEESILLDIGANIGSTCVPFAIKYKATIVAVEASKNNAFLLLKNAYLNKIKLIMHNICAVDPETAKHKEWLEFFSKNGNSAANSIFENWNTSLVKSSVEYVKTKTLDEILSDVDLHRIKLIKMDVEGAEEMVLKGFEKIESISAPILFEYRIDIMKRDLLDNGLGMLERLNRNFDLYAIASSKEGQVILTTFDSSIPCANAIAIPKKNKLSLMSRFSLEELGISNDE